MGTHASGVLWGRVAYAMRHAGRVRIQTFRQVQLGYKTALFAAAKLNRPVHDRVFGIDEHDLSRPAATVRKMRDGCHRGSDRRGKVQHR